MAGRSYKSLVPSASVLTTFNSLGRMVSQSDPDGVRTLYGHNTKGEVVDVALDINANGAIEAAGKDRITRTLNDVVNNSLYGQMVRRSRTLTFPNWDSDISLETGRVETSLNGLTTWTTSFGLVRTNIRTVPVNGSWTVSDFPPDGTHTITTYLSGRVATVLRLDSAGVQLGLSTHSYDPHGRVASVTDARNGTTTYAYDSSDRVVSTTSPAPGNGQSAQTASTVYDSRGRVIQVTAPDGAVTYNEYYPTGLLKKTYGGRSYPVEYTYDAQGRLKTMKTWQNFINNTGAALTTWNYDPARGWLISKRDNSNKDVDYTYTPGGRLVTRKNARQGIGGANLITTYTYGFQSPSEGNYFPEIRFTEPQNDPGNSWFTLFGYDRRGRKISEQKNGGVSYTYHDSGQVLSETYFSGILAGINLQYTLDSMLRRSSVTVRNGTTVLASTTYTFDPASRLASVTDGTYSAQYVYLANSSLVGQVLFNLKTVFAHNESSQGPGDKAIPNHSPDP